MINKAFPKQVDKIVRTSFQGTRASNTSVALVSANKLGETTALTNFFEISIHFLNKIQVIV